MLAELGTLRAFVVHGSDNLDELSTTGESRVSEVREGNVRTFSVRPEDFGLARASILGPPHAIGPLALEASRVSAPGALLVGDSAGFYDPFTGEGVTLALRSAEMAAAVADRALRSRHAVDLREYDRVRDAATRDKFRINRLLQRVVAWPTLSNAMARRLAQRPDLADRLVKLDAELSSTAATRTRSPVRVPSGRRRKQEATP